MTHDDGAAGADLDKVKRFTPGGEWWDQMVEASYGEWVRFSDYERLRSALRAPLEDFCSTCGDLVSRHFTPCNLASDAEGVLRLLVRLVNDGKKPAALRVLARHMNSHEDDGKQIVQSALRAPQILSYECPRHGWVADEHRCEAFDAAVKNPRIEPPPALRAPQPQEEFTALALKLVKALTPLFDDAHGNDVSVVRGLIRAHSSLAQVTRQEWLDAETKARIEWKELQRAALRAPQEGAPDPQPTNDTPIPRK